MPMRCEKATVMVVSSKAAVAAYARAFMHAFDPSTAAGRRLTGWLRHNGRVLGLDFDSAVRPPKRAGKRTRTPSGDRPLSAPTWIRLGKALTAIVGRETAA